MTMSPWLLLPLLLWAGVISAALADTSPERLVLEGSLKATLDATRRNPADYAAWQERRRALLTLTTSASKASNTLLLETELHTVADAAVRGAPKCFQVWLHRRRVLERLLLLEKEEGNPSSSRRLLLLREDLEWSWQGLVGVNGSSGDPKNVHAWSHRRWVLDQAMLQLEEEGEGEQRAAAVAALLQEEIEQTRELLEEWDQDNNSVWCYRYSLLRRMLALGGATGGDGDGNGEWAYQLCKAELLFTRRLLRPNPDNASAWAHLRGLLSPALASSLPSPARRKLHSLVTEAAMAHMVLSKVGHHHQGEGWLHARDLLVDLQLSPLRDPSAPPTLLGLIRAKRLAERTLAESNAVLTVRRGYWEWKLAQVQAAIDAKRVGGPSRRR